MQKTGRKLMRAACLCAILYAAAQGIRQVEQRLPYVRMEQAVQTAGQLLTREQTMQDAVAVCADALLHGEGDALSVSAPAEVRREDDEAH
ncbi:MAG: hypothetical protein ACI4PM_02515 [Butyricicoccus sp.]